MDEVFIIIGLILLNGLFSMSEISLISVRKSKLETEAKRGDKKAKRTLGLLSNPDKFLSTVQIGVTTIGILTGIFSGAGIQHALSGFFSQYSFISRFSDGLATVVVVFIVTYFTLVLGELVPKRIGLSSPEKISKTITPMMNVVSRVTFPFIWLLSMSTNLIVKLLRLENKNDIITEDEIKSMIDESTKQGEIASVEQDIIDKVFDLGDRYISSLMTHKDELKWLDIRMTRKEFIPYVRENLHSIYPLCDKDLDNIKGVVMTKDIFAAPDNATLEELSRPALFVPGNITVYKVMERLKRRRANVCFIVDEYGNPEGMVTLKDIFESIVGDVHGEDEIDKDIIKLEDKSYSVDGRVSFYDFLSYFDSEELYFQDEQLDTIAGFILHHLGHLPKAGETFSWKKFTFKIDKMEGNRIDKVLIKIESGELRVEN